MKKVGVGDVWVAAGQSNMTDMGAVTDDFSPEDDDPINENMHIIYAEDCTWQQMSHPAGEGRFFKTGSKNIAGNKFFLQEKLAKRKCTDWRCSNISRRYEHLAMDRRNKK